MTHSKAAALKYDTTTQKAPKVVASGRGNIAEKIIQKAKENDVALFSNPELVSSLLDVDLDSEIPMELYQAVAEVFGWLMKQEVKY